MELSKVKPSKIYDDGEMTFKSLLKQIINTKFNGFIRITTQNTNEGFILFKEGKGIAASYSRYLKNLVLDEELSKEDALRKIEYETRKRSYIIEVYELTSSQIDYAIKFNEKYVLENDNLSQYLKKHKKKQKGAQGEVLNKVYETSETYDEADSLETRDIKVSDGSSDDSYYKILTGNLNGQYNPIEEDVARYHEKNNESLGIFDSSSVVGSFHGSETIQILDKEEPEKAPAKNIKSLIRAIKGSQEKPEKRKPPTTTHNSQRSMKELKLLLNSLNQDEIEMIELNIMNNIKKAILHISKVKEKSVSISIDRKKGLMGNVNIVAEYTDKGFLDLLTGSSKDDIYYLEDLIYDSTQVEIKKVFGNFQDVLDYFDISIKVI